MGDHLSDQLNTSFVRLGDQNIACLGISARCNGSCSTNDVNLGWDYLFDWPIETIIIFSIPFGDASSTEITRLTFNVPIEEAYICDAYGKQN